MAKKPQLISVPGGDDPKIVTAEGLRSVQATIYEQAPEMRRDPATDIGLWRQTVLDRYQGKCSNDGSTDRVQVHFVVPLEAGGQLVESNGYVLCRACEMAREAATKGIALKRRPINFWVSRSLSDTLERLTAQGQRFRGMGELIRYLISLYILNDSRFDDLDNYQDRGADLKVNAWVGVEAYETFKNLLVQRKTTVTDALKGLILMYADTAMEHVSDSVEAPIDPTQESSKDEAS